ncbi:MAG: DUF3352 domain-containing protein [Saprospiraceae bacterium]
MSIEKRPNTRARRIFLALISVLIAALLLYLFLPRNAGAFRAVPGQTSLLLECNGLLRAKILTNKTADAHWREVLHSALFERCFNDTEAALQLFKHDPDIFKALAKNKALAAFSLHPADSLHALFALELDEDFDLEKALKTNKLTPKYFPHQFHGNDIFNVHLSKTERLEVAVSGRLLLFSRRATLVEDALAQLENAHNWWADRPYISNLPEAAFRLHLRPDALAEQLRGQMNPRWRGLPDLLARNVTWLGLSWNGTEIKTLAETTGFLSTLNSWGEPPTDAIFNVLPDNTAFLARAGLGHIPEFFREIGDGRASDFEQYVLPWVGAEAAIAVTEPLSPSLTGDRLLLLSVRDSALALNGLRAFGKERGTMPIASGQYQMFELLGFQNSSLVKPLLSNDEAFRNPVCTFVDGFAVFAPDRSSLEIFLDKYLVNQTLAANTDFLQLQQKVSQKGHASFLLNTAYLPSLLRNISGIEWETSLAKTGFIAVEWLPGFGRKAEPVLTTQALSQPLAETDILWKSVLAAPVITQPYLVEQPEGKIFVLVQDLKKNLHCLDAQNGESVWSRPLSDRILSDIRGIDFYGNGMKCYTFSTAKQIFTLDEKGLDIQGFPFNLPTRANIGVTVVDFDQNSKFNYFVACGNDKIYGFGHLGRPLDGWNGVAIPDNSTTGKRKTKGKDPVGQSILHFQHKGKDYLAVLTENGLLSVFGRDGALRFPPVQLEGIPEGSEGIVNYFSPMAVDAGSTTPRIYTSNTEGHVIACDLQGKVSMDKVASLGGTVAAFGQLTGDARFEWAAFEGKRLTVGTWGKQLFKSQFPENQQIVFFTQSKIATVDERGRRIWMLDNKGKMLPGFPLGGNTKFEFALINGVNMLVVGNGNGVWAYRVR